MSTTTDRTTSRFMLDGYPISEVEFFLDEQGWVLGYMVGEDDGKTLLSVDAHDAIEHYKAKRSQADGEP